MQYIALITVNSLEKSSHVNLLLKCIVLNLNILLIVIIKS
jgi:hypothetical protein